MTTDKGSGNKISYESVLVIELFENFGGPTRVDSERLQRTVLSVQYSK